MSITTVQGDIVKLAERGLIDILIQGCNCFCVQGSGLAGQLRKYPSVLEADKQTLPGSRLKLGKFTAARCHCPETDNSFTVFNAYTQYETAKFPGEDVFEYKAFEHLCAYIFLLYGESNSVTIGFPQIGAGLAGGDWTRIRSILESYFDDAALEVVIVEYKP